MGNPTEPTPVAPQDEPLHCPLCDYNLHGLPEPRCPECGYAFDWDELRIAIREKKSWFFEHAERRLVRSFVRTAALTFLPSKLWKKVSAGHRSSPWRLTLFTTVCLAWPVVALTISMLAIAAINGVLEVRQTPRITSFAEALERWLEITGGSLDFLFNIALRSGWLILIALIVCPPIVSWLALNIFGTTLRRAGVKRVHTFRAIAYAWCPFLLTAGLLQCALWWRGSWSWQMYDLLSDYRDAIFWIELVGPLEVVVTLFLLLAWAGWNVRQSLKHYLRIPQATLTAILIHAVILMANLLLALLAGSLLRYTPWRDW
jgi:hypothetical protein